MGGALSRFGDAETAFNGRSAGFTYNIGRVVSAAAPWAVGTLASTSSVSTTLTQRYSYACVTPTPAPTATATPIPPRCPTERFTDVCPSDYFYEPVLASLPRADRVERTLLERVRAFLRDGEVLAQPHDDVRVHRAECNDRPRCAWPATTSSPATPTASQ